MLEGLVTQDQILLVFCTQRFQIILILFSSFEIVYVFMSLKEKITLKLKKQDKIQKIWNYFKSWEQLKC